MNRLTFISIVIAASLIMLAFVFTSPAPATTDDPLPENNVSVVDGVQIVDLRAKGGYSPKTSVAQAGIPTVIRFNTNGTYDCSAAVSIPSLKLQTLLVPSGTTEMDIGTPQAGTLQGSCSMGMYPFAIEFE
jgi:plastocyanin domain-containing protein